MREKIKEVMQRVFQLDSVSDDISQKSCNKWDSMQHLNLIVELEEEFDVSFEPEEIAEMKNLYKIVKILQTK